MLELAQGPLRFEFLYFFVLDHPLPAPRGKRNCVSPIPIPAQRFAPRWSSTTFTSKVKNEQSSMTAGRVSPWPELPGSSPSAKRSWVTSKNLSPCVSKCLFTAIKTTAVAHAKCKVLGPGFTGPGFLEITLRESISVFHIFVYM